MYCLVARDACTHAALFEVTEYSTWNDDSGELLLKDPDKDLLNVSD